MTVAKKLVKLEDDKYYISADSTYADDRVQVLNHRDTFGIFDRWGDILPIGKDIRGIYHRDTRYISRIEMRLNGYRPTLLSSTIKEENEMLSADLTNPEMKLTSGESLHHGSVHIRRSQFIRSSAFHEKIKLTNFADTPLTVNISLSFHGDFKDIFEVRGMKRAKRGELTDYTFSEDKKMSFGYIGLDKIKRTSHIEFSKPFSDVNEETSEVSFDISLKPDQTSVLTYRILFKLDDENIPAPSYDVVDEGMDPEVERAKAYFPSIITANEQFTHWITRSKTDLISLMATTDYGKYPYAGVPWYNTAFGRDGLITAFETLWVAPRLSRDVLNFLAANQAEEFNAEADAEPGKILHETRGGEMVNLNEVPFKKYYGTIDATPLFIMLAGEYFDRTADIDFIKKIWPNIQAAIQWIDEYGDLDGDGFVEYKHKAENGLTNQGWKDSFDAVSYANGDLAEPAIALCEVQGYVYSAKLHAAKLACCLGETDLAEKLKAEAKTLKEKFNETFWDEDLQCFVLALDGNKKPCRVKSSNAGQVLFTEIADPDKAAKLAKTLMENDMFNGWGIRTLSSNEIRYNPMSYHNGSVWPHDVALIGYGLAKYGFREEASRLITGLFDASLYINLQRLPELFCGFPRRRGEGPTSYPVACSPQAWSVAAVFMLLQAILQIKILPATKEIVFDKSILPGYIQNIMIHGLSLGDKNVDLEIIRYEQDNMVGVNWQNQPDDWKLVVVK